MIYCGDCIEILQTLPDQSVHCCVTSPPYFGLRDYGTEGQLGLEATPEDYVAKLVAALREQLTNRNALRAQREQPNEPLTLEELRGMYGQPVWCSETKCWGIVVVEEGGQWDGTPFLLGYDGCEFILDIESRGLTLYRRKPEQEGG